MMKINKHTIIAGLTLCVLAGLLFAPIGKTITIPAIAVISNMDRVYAPADAEVIEIHVAEGQAVSKGEKLAVFASPQLEFELQQVKIQRDILLINKSREAAQQTAMEHRLTIEQRLLEKERKIAALQSELQKLTIYAKSDGVVVKRAPMKPAQWVRSGDFLMVIKPDIAKWQLRAYVAEGDVERVLPDATATWVADDPLSMPSGPVRLRSISTTAIQDFPDPALLSDFGGPLASIQDDTGRALPQSPLYLATLDVPIDRFERSQQITGVIHLPVTPVSAANKVFRHITSILIRESGF